jgi:hypothetical protein
MFAAITIAAGYPNTLSCWNILIVFQAPANTMSIVPNLGFARLATGYVEYPITLNLAAEPSATTILVRCSHLRQEAHHSARRDSVRHDQKMSAPRAKATTKPPQKTGSVSNLSISSSLTSPNSGVTLDNLNVVISKGNWSFKWQRSSAETTLSSCAAHIPMSATTARTIIGFPLAVD